VSIHKRDCVNVPEDIQEADEPGRWVRVTWENDEQQVFKANIMLEVQDRVGMLADLTTQLASMRVMIYAVNVREPKSGNSAIHLTVGVNSVEHLQFVIDRLSKVSGVYSIQRGSYT